MANGQENAPLFNLAKLPKEIEVPREVIEQDPMGVSLFIGCVNFKSYIKLYAKVIVEERKIRQQQISKKSCLIFSHNDSRLSI